MILLAVNMKQANLGILVYIDNNSEMIEEFMWLYKSILFSKLSDECAIIAVCHPSVMDQIPIDSRIRILVSVPYAEQNAAWAGYKYINSVSNLAEAAVLSACADFDFILKTDCDTFVTEYLSDFRPSGLCFGFGAYAYQDSVRKKLVECSERWGFPHNGSHNVGASVMGPTEMVSEFLTVHMQCCERLLREEFTDFVGEWPNWSKQVLTMYAGELALRLTYPQRCSFGLLDHFTNTRKLASDVLHIHAWHTDDYWSKHAYRSGMYDSMALDQIDKTTLGGYCHWLAAASLDEVKQYTGDRSS
jgi:hypothetical protein